MPTNPDELFQEAACFNCNSNASLADLLKLALLDRISESGGGGGTPSAPLNSVQFNNAGAFGGSADFTFDGATSLLQVDGQVVIGSSAVAGFNPANSALDIYAPDMFIYVDSDAAGIWGVKFRGLGAGYVDIFGFTGNGATGQITLGSLHAAYFLSLMSANTEALRFTTTGFANFPAAQVVGWGSTTAASATDTAFSRQAAGIVEVNNGAVGTFRDLEVRNIFTNNNAAALSTNTTLTDNAGGGAGTLTNAPSAGDPTKWIAIDDNGTPRFIPTWT